MSRLAFLNHIAGAADGDVQNDHAQHDLVHYERVSALHARHVGDVLRRDESRKDPQVGAEADHVADGEVDAGVPVNDDQNI